MTDSVKKHKAHGEAVDSASFTILWLFIYKMINILIYKKQQVSQ